MKTKTKKLLPKTPDEISNGGVYLQQVRCGKRNCKCARGEKHTAYYFFYYSGKKLRKTYVPKSKVKSLTEIVCQAAANRRAKRQFNEQIKGALRDSRRLLGETKSIHTGIERSKQWLSLNLRKTHS